MQNSVNPGYRKPVHMLLRAGKRIFSTISLLFLIAGFCSEATALPPGVPDFTHPNTRLQVTQDYSPADNTAKNIIEAHVVDEFGNPVAGVTVYFTPAPGNVTISVVTNAAGVAELQLASGQVGPVQINARIGSTNFTPVTVTFTAYQPDVTNEETRLEVVDDGAIANGTMTNTVKAVIVDADGNPVPNQSVTFSIASGTATFTTPVTVTTDANGEAFVSLSSNTPGSVSITATVNGDPITNNSPATVVFVVNTPVVNVPSTRLEPGNNGALANGTATNSVRAIITDAGGNPVANQSVTFSIASGTATFTTPVTVTTDANGVATVSLSSNTPGTVTVTATVNGTPIVNGSPASVEFVENVPNVNVPTTRIEVVTTGAIANDVDLNTVRVIITDAGGNPVPGQTVTFTITSGTAVFVGSTTLSTDANGEVIINLQSTVAGAVTITATVNGTPIINGSPAEVEFVAGPPNLANPLTALVIDANNAYANGTATNIVRAHIVDAFGNPVAGQTIEFTIVSGTATPAGALTGTTDANGNVILTLTSNIAGDVVISATMNGTSIINGNPSTVTFTNYPDFANPATALIVVTDNAIANNTATNSVRAHVIDNNGNPLENAEVIFVIASGDGTIITPQPVMTDANGDAVIFIVSNTPGIVTITATIKGEPIINGSPARVRFTEENVWVPRVFTPNGDGTNDVVRPVVNGVFNLQYFNIYNRWGNLLFTTNNITQGWDGRYKGVMQPNETYLWIMVGTNAANERVQKRGMISLVR